MCASLALACGASTPQPESTATQRAPSSDSDPYASDDPDPPELAGPDHDAIDDTALPDTGDLRVPGSVLPTASGWYCWSAQDPKGLPLPGECWRALSDCEGHVADMRQGLPQVTYTECTQYDTASCDTFASARAGAKGYTCMPSANDCELDRDYSMNNTADYSEISACEPTP